MSARPSSRVCTARSDSSNGAKVLVDILGSYTTRRMDPRAFLAEHLTPPTSWPVAIALGLLVVITLELVYRIVFRWLKALTEKTSTHLDDVLVRRMRIPAQVLVFLAGANVLFSARGVENAIVSKAVTLVELLLVAYLIIEAAETALLDFWLGEKRKVQVPNVVRGLALLILYTVAVGIIIGSVTGVNVAPILATSTVITVVLGLALQDTLGNLFSGLALSLDKPFVKGEWILIDTVEGRVEEMGWRAVSLRTFTWDIVVVPNSAISKARVQNFSRPDRVTGRNVDVVVPANTDPAHFEKVARAACAKVQAVMVDPRPKLWLIEMTPLTQRWIIRVWIEDFAHNDDIESDVRRAFVSECLANGLTMPPASPLPAVAVVSGPSA
jgi:small-conductance mechanosensitive channel